METTTDYFLKGELLAGCNCDWGCPCSFEAPPTKGFCDGIYLWNFKQGQYGDVRLDGLSLAMCAHSPAAPHLGNLTEIVLVDDKATAPQREAIESMVATIPPFAIFYSLTTTFLGFEYLRFDLEFNGVHSRASIEGALEMKLTPMTNPVTGEDEPATLLKPKGFTSKIQELCATSALRLTTDTLSYDHSGQYGEFSPFEYKGDTLD